MIRLVIVLVLIGAAIFGYLQWQEHREDEVRSEYLRHAGVIAETQVAAELYRLQPDSFKIVRDSILEKYNVTLEHMQEFKDRYKGDEERWSMLWFHVDSLVDSMVNYYDSALKADSIKKADSLASDTASE